MPCNTAHAQAAGIRAVADAGEVPFLDMITETVAVASATGRTHVGVLATPGGEGLYAPALSAAGLGPVTLTGPEREAFMSLIYGVKAGDVSAAARAEMGDLAGALVAQGAGALIAGCTEVPLLLSAAEVSVPLVDSSEVLARACVRACV